jgi:hypothetical protein
MGGGFQVSTIPPPRVGDLVRRLVSSVETCETEVMLETLQRLLGLDPSLDRVVVSKRLRRTNIWMSVAFIVALVLADSVVVKVIVLVVFVASSLAIILLARKVARVAGPPGAKPAGPDPASEA